MLQGVCTAGVSGVCKGARRFCQKCPLFDASSTRSSVPDIEDITLANSANSKRTTRPTARQRRVVTIDSTKTVASQGSHSTSTVKLATTFGLETDGPPSSVVPQLPFKLKQQRRRHSSVAVLNDDLYPAPPPPPPPSDTISFSSTAGKRMFAEALCEGYHENYFRLSEQYQTLPVHDSHADSGAECLAMLLNAMHIDPGETDVTANPIWKGVWRWFSSDMLRAATRCNLSKGSDAMLSLSGFACLAQRALASHSDCSVSAIAKKDTDLSTFRIHVQYIASSQTSFLVPMFDKARLLGGGNCRRCEGSATAMFSPIAGYHSASDSVLILDVDRHHTTPYWVPLKELHGSLVDGYCVVASEASDSDVPRLVKTLRCGVACDASLNKRVVSGIVEDMRKDAALLETVVGGRLHQYIKGVEGGEDVRGVRDRDNEDSILAVTAMLLASPRDMFMQVLPEKHQAALWWMKRADQSAIDASIHKWSQQLRPAVAVSA